MRVEFPLSEVLCTEEAKLVQRYIGMYFDFIENMYLRIVNSYPKFTWIGFIRIQMTLI